MATFAVGTIVSVLFPFSNLKGKKLRPALILAMSEFDNPILCQITSKPYSSKKAIRIENSDCIEGGLSITSFARPDKLFTAERSIIKSNLGTLNVKKKDTILKTVRELFIER